MTVEGIDDLEQCRLKAKNILKQWGMRMQTMSVEQNV